MSYVPSYFISINPFMLKSIFLWFITLKTFHKVINIEFLLHKITINVLPHAFILSLCHLSNSQIAINMSQFMEIQRPLKSIWQKLFELSLLTKCFLQVACLQQQCSLVQTLTHMYMDICQKCEFNFVHCIQCNK